LWVLGRGLLTFSGAIFCLFVLFMLAVQLQHVFALSPQYAPYAQVAPHAQWYPVLTHTIADYPHWD
jgi:hypothetical protein